MLAPCRALPSTAVAGCSAPPGYCQAHYTHNRHPVSLGTVFHFSFSFRVKCCFILLFYSFVFAFFVPLVVSDVCVCVFLTPARPVARETLASSAGRESFGIRRMIFSKRLGLLANARQIRSGALVGRRYDRFVHLARGLRLSLSG